MKFLQKRMDKLSDFFLQTAQGLFVSSMVGYVGLEEVLSISIIDMLSGTLGSIAFLIIGLYAIRKGTHE